MSGVGETYLLTAVTYSVPGLFTFLFLCLITTS